MVKKDERFELLKLARSSSGKFHRIMIDHSRNDLICCTCTGYIHYRHCKHMDAYNRGDKRMIVDPAVGMAELLGDSSLKDINNSSEQK